MRNNFNMMNAESCKESSVSNVFWQNVEALAFTDPLRACLNGETMVQAKRSMLWRRMASLTLDRGG